MTAAPSTSAALVKADDFFSSDQIDLIRKSIVPDATELEFRGLMEVARLRKLNPLLRQIHFVKRRAWDDATNSYVERWAFQVAIDGFRAIAQRTGEYDGQDETEFEYGPDGVTPIRARTRVYRKGISRPFVGVADYSEYVQTKRDGKPNNMWATKPRVMLGKCSEAVAFRKAFPEDTSGFYVEEEIARDDAPANDGGAPTLGGSIKHGRKDPEPIRVTMPNSLDSARHAQALCGELESATTKAAMLAILGRADTLWKAGDLFTEHRAEVLTHYETVLAKKKAEAKARQGGDAAPPAPGSSPTTGGAP